MKHAKRITSFLLALVMVLALGVTAFAEEANGSITINSPATGETYKIYKILTLESYNTTSGAYSYKVGTDWEGFFTGDGKGATYFKVDDQKYVSLKDDVTLDSDSSEAAQLAKDALEYANSHTGITPVASLPDNSSYTASGLGLGYYLVDSSLGALCGLTTTKPTATVNEKNTAPTIEKLVQEGEKWVENNDASIGDTVYFKTTINAKKGAQKYVLHDQMSAGLTLNQNSIMVEGATKDTDYTVAFNKNCTDKQNESAVCNFEITFTESYLNKITEDRSIVVTYNAVLNKDAVIYTGTNDNETKLDYGDGSHTEWDKTTTKTFEFDLVKTKTDKTLLSGAEFELYGSKDGTDKIELVEVTADNGEVYYRVATSAEKVGGEFTSAVIKAGKVTIKGLDSGTYWLQETVAPEGYNKLAGRKEVVISNNNLSATMNDTGNTYVEGGIQVENKTGTELPSTGGVGTTIFYVLGSVLVIGAAVLLITKKRMNAEA